MKIGDIIGGYRLTTNASSAGGGRSLWSLAEREGRPYFIKQFLSPKFPVDAAPGSAATKTQALKRCEAFETRQARILAAMKGKVASGGSLVAPIEFLRVGSTYYKIYDRIDTVTLSPDEVATLPFSEKILILQVAAHSVDILHKLDIVHGDLKPDNILIKRTDSGVFTAKLIDFDDSYFAGAPPGSELVVGDPAYYSPELLAYIVAEDDTLGGTIGLKADIFALALVFCQFMGGRLPGRDPKRDANVAALVARGGTVNPAECGCPDELGVLVSEMLALNPTDRPAADQVRDRLKAMRHPITPPAPCFVAEAGSSRLRTKRAMGATASAAPTGAPASVIAPAPAAPDKVEEPVSRLKIKPRKP